MDWLAQKWANFVARIKESLTWLSVRVMIGWAAVWTIFSQLPANVITELAQINILHISVVSWMGIAQTVTVYLARVKKTPGT